MVDEHPETTFPSLKLFLFGTRQLSRLIPGVCLGIVVMLVSVGLARLAEELLPAGKNPFSPILIAIVLGMVIRNSFYLSAPFYPGIRFGFKKLLRLGIILLGIRLTLFSIVKIGLHSAGLIAVCIAVALSITVIISRWIGVNERMGLLIAAGTGICGVSAIVATCSTIEANEEETAYAVGVITLFGILATVTYPYLVEMVLNLSVTEAGFFLGTAVHDTSQVTASGLIYDQLWAQQTSNGLSGADIAITTKLVRNSFMILVIPLLGLWSNRGRKGSPVKKRIPITRLVPFFVIGFLLMGLVRSLGDAVFGEASTQWLTIWQTVKDIASLVIAVAIACVGLNTDLRRLVKLGFKPLIAGLIAAVTVGFISLLLITLFSRHLSL